jgi:hypothetical protein
MVNRLLTTATLAALALCFPLISFWIIGSLLVALTTR